MREKKGESGERERERRRKKRRSTYEKAKM